MKSSGSRRVSTILMTLLNGAKVEIDFLVDLIEKKIIFLLKFKKNIKFKKMTKI
jgi:hypothetical protein